MLFDQALHQLRLFARRPAAVFFVIFMPLILLGVFTEIFGNDPIGETGFTTAQFYTPGLAVFGVVSACYTYLAVSTAIARDQGILKRVRTTPLPAPVYIWARILAVTVIAIVSAALVMGAGAIFYNVHIYAERIVAAIVVMIAGALCFSALGMMVVALCRTSETTQAVTTATLLPLAFISDIFIRPGNDTPGWMVMVADFFPLKHFAVAFGYAFRPGFEGHGFAWGGPDGTYMILPTLAVLAAWGAVATLVAVWMFTWEPEEG